MRDLNQHNFPADEKGIGVDIHKLRKLSDESGLTQEQLAKRAGLSSRHKWSDFVNGHREITTIQTLEKIAAALGVKAKDLLK